MARITAPGKFEGEQEYVKHFYEVYLETGCWDYEKGNCIGFKVEKEDKLKFPELKKRKTVWLWLRDDGFVQEV